MVDATHVYWSSASNDKICKAIKDKTVQAPTLISTTAVSTARNGPGWVAVDATHIYWSEQDGLNGGVGGVGGVYKCLLGGCASPTKPASTT